MRWTPDKIEDLRNIARNGLSMTDAARYLSTTRSAVAGIVYRTEPRIVFVRSPRRNALVRALNKRMRDG